MSKRRLPEMYVFKITKSWCEEPQISETSKRSCPETKKFRNNIVRNVISSKNTLVCLYRNGQHCVVFKSYKFSGNVFFILSFRENVFHRVGNKNSRIFHSEQIFFDNFSFRESYQSKWDDPSIAFL